MKLFEQTHSCLMDILYKKTPFKLAVENTCTKYTVFREDRKNLTNILGCSLRHYYVFEYLISLLEKELSEEQHAALLLYLSNHLFVPVLSANEVDSLLSKLSIDKKDIDKLSFSSFILILKDLTPSLFLDNKLFFIFSPGGRDRNRPRSTVRNAAGATPSALRP